MPQEFLCDVLRTGDAAGRARRRLSILPVTIGLHAAVAGVFVIAPLVAEHDVPDAPTPAIRIVQLASPTPPAPPPPSDPNPSTSIDRRAAPTIAPAAILQETDPPPAYSGPPGPPGAIDVGVGAPSFSVLSDANVSPLAEPPPPPQPPPVVRVGHGVRVPQKLVHVAPVYPITARIAHVEGVVILEAVLDERGRVDRVKVLRSRPLLDQAAIEAVRQWRYTPTLLNGVPVPVLMTITVEFSLKD